jgi:nucleoside diphosphate kinase
VLQGDNAILKNRDLMGATDPEKAAGHDTRDFAARSMPTRYTVRMRRRPR